jgi:hypothetical protein
LQLSDDKVLHDVILHYVNQKAPLKIRARDAARKMSRHRIQLAKMGCPTTLILGYNDTHRTKLDTPTIHPLSAGRTHLQTGESCNHDEGQT